MVLIILTSTVQVLTKKAETENDFLKKALYLQSKSKAWFLYDRDLRPYSEILKIKSIN